MNWGPLKADGRMAAKSAVKIRAALTQTADFKRIFQWYEETQPNISGNRAQDRARARAWVMLNVRVNMTPLVGVLERVYAEGWVTGEAGANEALINMREVKKAADDLIDWSKWQPGDQAAALLIRPTKAFERFLGSFGVTMKDLTNTTVGDIGNSIADALEQGLSANQAAKLIRGNVASSSRALTIAITEQNRAMSAATINRYKDMQIQEMEWEVSDPCPKCAQNANQVVQIGGTFNSGNTQPPAHPNCRCALLPVIPDFDQIGMQNGVVDTAPAQAMSPEKMQELNNYQLQDPKFMEIAYKQPGVRGETEAYQALSDYKSYGYGKINEYLRSGHGAQHAGIEQTKDSIKAMDKAMKAAPGLPEPVVTYRVLGQVNSSDIDELFGSLEPGDVWIDKGFSSTSLSKEYVESFKKGWMVEIENPQGTKGIMLDGLKGKGGYTSFEDEWLLPRNTNFEVIEINPITREMKVRVKQ
jgi:SPP1 gp7 family putative phage head morphogenesis protein